ncbi:hypothetical protein ACJIZ3_010926 [Penstemon smallii]|uniref:Uncharacterized protein n=1 Tax=Penstemon smallii TaxID=265156 RepID=A0ABD3UHP0_9LAMI
MVTGGDRISLRLSEPIDTILTLIRTQFCNRQMNVEMSQPPKNSSKSVQILCMIRDMSRLINDRFFFLIVDINHGTIEGQNLTCIGQCIQAWRRR